LSYFLLANSKKWITKTLIPYVFVEEYAKDSYENLLFSICRFKEITHRYPSRITVVGFDFKAYRFTELHRKAIRFPQSNFTYIGLKPLHPNFDLIEAQKGENVAVEEFMKDMYGCRDMNLIIKREKRNPFLRTTPYDAACPELHALMKWCGINLFSETQLLPWRH
jgi:hypothetical protein